jgi:flavin-dependent dehydrogenase
MSSDYDVAIIGAGPAGCSAAILLAERGRTVVVLEREKFPRFKIGESLLPHSMAAFTRLGIRERLEAMAFPKFGGEIATGAGERAVKFYFKDGFGSRHTQAYQVKRADFDQLLMDRARECGAEIREEVSVEKVDLRPDGATLRLADGEVRAQYVVDGSGRQSVLGRQLGLKHDYPHLKKLSCYAHYDGVQRDEGIDAGLTRLVHARDHWFWLIPLTDSRTSIGVVMDSADFRARKATPEAVLAATLEESPLMRERMAGASRVTPVYSAGDYSYRNSQLAGDRWLLAGDAAGFIDPIFSTGVFIALESGEQCAKALDVALSQPSKRRRLFRRYERAVHRTMDVYLRFVTAWYRPEFVEVFTTPTQRFQLAPAVNAVLAGNIGGSFAIWWRMQVFYLVLLLQRYLPLCPKLAPPERAEEPALATAV